MNLAFRVKYEYVRTSLATLVFGITAVQTQPSFTAKLQYSIHSFAIWALRDHCTADATRVFRVPLCAQ